MVNIGNSWDNILKDEFEKEYYQELRRFLITEYRTRQIYPDMYDIFNALRYTSYEDVKAVIIGQDPYHQPGQAHARTGIHAGGQMEMPRQRLRREGKPGAESRL